MAHGSLTIGPSIRRKGRTGRGGWEGRHLDSSAPVSSPQMCKSEKRAWVWVQEGSGVPRKGMTGTAGQTDKSRGHLT